MVFFEDRFASVRYDIGVNWERVTHKHRSNPNWFEKSIDYMNKIVEHELELDIKFEMNYEGLTKTEYRDYFNYFIQQQKQEYHRVLEDEQYKTSIIAGDDEFEVKLPPGGFFNSYVRLLSEKKFSEIDISNITEASRIILNKSHLRENKYHCDFFNKEVYRPTKGLVVGKVQSGKTATMAGLISMSIDNGYNVILVLGGSLTNLRAQTEDRFKLDLFKKLNSDQKNKINFLDSQQIENPQSDMSHQCFYQRIDLKGSVSIGVVLKHHKRVVNAKNWLDHLVQNNLGQNLKVLIIDDECDQGGINTQVSKNKETTVFKNIRDLVYVDKIKHTSYVGFTATPAASVLNDGPKMKKGYKRNLFPNDFIISLKSSNAYWGANRYFQSRNEIPLGVVNLVSQNDKDDLLELIENDCKFDPNDLPNSFKDSINWFLVALSIRRFSHKNSSKKSVISMLVNFSTSIANNNRAGALIKQYLKTFFDSKTCLDQLKESYKKNTEFFTKDDFEKNWSNYPYIDSVKDYPSWVELEPFILDTIENNVDHIKFDETDSKIQKRKYGNHIHLCVDNSKPSMQDEEPDDRIYRLNYPNEHELMNAEFDNVAAFIVVGGNTLSRGLTIDGLVSAYFLRTTTAADTLMQMGRWFGYRVGYELLPRVWMEEQIRESFEQMIYAEEGFHEFIVQNYSDFNKPEQIAPQILSNPSYQLLPTSRNRMNGAISDAEYAGVNPQILRYDKSYLKENFACFSQLTIDLKGYKYQYYKALNSINIQKVSNSLIIDFLNEYKFFNGERLFSKYKSEFIAWLKEGVSSNAIPSKWNVSINVNQHKEGSIIQFDGSDYGCVNRKNKASNEPYYKYGAIRTPSNGEIKADIVDSFKDFDSFKFNELLEKRTELNNMKAPPLLLLYPIQEGEDIVVGISIIIPNYKLMNAPNTYSVSMQD